jgi:hypothetical protein
MKVIYGSLGAMLAELKGRKGEAVRVSPLIRSESDRTTGIPYHTSRILVTAELDDGCWAECRLWVGRGMDEIAEGGLRLPEALRQRGQTLLGEVRGRIEAEGFRVLDGMVAHEAEAVDGGIE